MKDTEFWDYEKISLVDYSQDKFDAVKLKGRFLEDAETLFELVSFFRHPSFSLPEGKEHLEPNSLKFSNFRIDLNSAKILLTLLQNSKISNLRFCNNNFDLSVLSYLISSLIKRRHSITSLVIEWNSTVYSRSNRLDLAEDEESLYDEMKEDLLKSREAVASVGEIKSLEALCLRGCYLGDQSISTLLYSLLVNKTIKVLNLYKCNLTDTAVEKVADFLFQDSSLADLNLGGNKLTDKTLVLLKEELGYIEIEEEEIEDLKKKLDEKEQTLKKNEKLKAAKKPELPVPRGYPIVERNEKFYLERNVSLRNLVLIHNNLSSDCFDDLSDVLHSSPGLFLTVDFKAFSKEQRDSLLVPGENQQINIYFSK